MTWTLGSLFSGCGLMDLGLEAAGMRTIWHAETDRPASRVLARHWPGLTNYGDVELIDWAAVPRPDVLAGGFPCPPFSVAGLGLGRDDPRYLWPAFARAIRHLRPRFVIVENVAAFVSHDGGSCFGELIGDLAAAGYDARWACVRASDVGAPHRRERLFVIAYAGGRSAADAEHPGPLRPPGRSPALLTGPGGGTAADAHQPGGEARDDAGSERARLRGESVGSAPPAADAAGARWTWTERAGAGGGPGPGDRADWGRFGPAVARWEQISGRRSPPPLDRRGRLNVALVEWLMGAPAGWTRSESRSAALRCLGNAVVVQVAEAVGRWALR